MKTEYLLLPRLLLSMILGANVLLSSGWAVANVDPFAGRFFDNRGTSIPHGGEPTANADPEPGRSEAPAGVADKTPPATRWSDPDAAAEYPQVLHSANRADVGSGLPNAS